jgi:hypothetical protein
MINIFCIFNALKKIDAMKKTKEKSLKMLAYSKKVLSKMTFDVLLFNKELSKAYQNLLEEEVDELRCWVNETFGPQYTLQLVVIKNKRIR